MTWGPYFFQSVVKVRVSGLSLILEEGLTFLVAQTLAFLAIPEGKAPRCTVAYLDVLFVVLAQNGLLYSLHLGLEGLQL